VRNTRLAFPDAQHYHQPSCSKPPPPGLVPQALTELAVVFADALFDASPRLSPSRRLTALWQQSVVMSCGLWPNPAPCRTAACSRRRGRRDRVVRRKNVGDGSPATRRHCRHKEDPPALGRGDVLPDIALDCSGGTSKIGRQPHSPRHGTMSVDSAEVAWVRFPSPAPSSGDPFH